MQFLRINLLFSPYFIISFRFSYIYFTMLYDIIKWCVNCFKIYIKSNIVSLTLSKIYPKSFGLTLCQFIPVTPYIKQKLEITYFRNYAIDYVSVTMLHY